MKWKLGLSENDDIKLGERIKRGLIKCKTPMITKGRIYDLTQKGLTVRKNLLDSLNEKIRTQLLNETHSTYLHINPPKKMDWIKYARVIASIKLKLPIFEVLSADWIRAVDEYTGKGEKKEHKCGIQSLLKNKKIEINWSNLVEELKEMASMGIIEIKHEKGRKNYYRVNKDGIIIKKWLHKIRFLNNGVI